MLTIYTNYYPLAIMKPLTVIIFNMFIMDRLVPWLLRCGQVVDHASQFITTTDPEFADFIAESGAPAARPSRWQRGIHKNAEFNRQLDGQSW